MQLISRLEQESRLDRVVSAGQRAARLIRPGKLRDVLAREAGGAIHVCLPGAG